MEKKEKPIANPSVVLREEFDDWAVLFDPETGHAFGLNPTGVYIWKLLDGERTMDELVREIRAGARDTPGETGEHVGGFVDALVAEGLAGLDATRFDPESGPEKNSSLTRVEGDAINPFTYAVPQLVNLREGQAVYGANCSNGSGATNTCGTGNLACSCSSGTGRSPACCGGACYGVSCCGGACDSTFCNNGSCTTYCGSGSSVSICNSGNYPTGGNCWAGTGGS
jgi:SynChlorMet cassette protein ScmD